MSCDISLIKFKNPKQKEFSEDVYSFIVSEVISTLKSNIPNIEIDDYWCVIDDAFGNEVNPSNEDSNPFRYCGEYYDVETGTYYLRARYYDPRIGRFLSEDTH